MDSGLSVPMNRIHQGTHLVSAVAASGTARGGPRFGGRGFCFARCQGDFRLMFTNEKGDLRMV